MNKSPTDQSTQEHLPIFYDMLRDARCGKTKPIQDYQSQFESSIEYLQFEATYLHTTVKPRFTGLNREARYIGVHFTLIYT